MRDDRLFLHVDYTFGPIDIDGNLKDAKYPVAPRGLASFRDFVGGELEGVYFFNMADETLADTTELLYLITMSQKVKPVRCMALVKVATANALWTGICKYAKDIYFLQGKVLQNDGQPYSIPLALVIFYGELRGSPMVFTLNVDELPPCEGEFNRKQLLYVRHLENSQATAPKPVAREKPAAKEKPAAREKAAGKKASSPPSPR